MTQNSKQTLKTVASVLAIGAAVAGIIYYFKDNEKVQQVLGDARTKAQEGFGSVKDSINHLADTAQKRFSRTA